MVRCCVGHLWGSLYRGCDGSSLRVGRVEAPVEDQDSFVDGLLDCPHYTRPESILSNKESVRELSVPKVLLGGDHQAIKKWREKQSLGRTFQRRPDLIEKLDLNDEQKALLQEYIQEHQN